ncbi:hypothetical protein EYW49_06590 [Siculibacillus lacustris]|uniref:Capsule biosynthesis protein n=1 Tax=Siculibacillus lacustris TaxID=1549641 RepID=A0A4Q9VU54_9HYPH|nr:hypothetical protein [Siculibacillus lacustris]TBW39532.1 hypothetical protein EYW49_06590 [Siculibacillus lacustris]
MNRILRSASRTVAVATDRDPANRASEAYVALVRMRARITRWVFVLAVIVPTLSAAVFYGVLAGPRYASEARFIVRSVSSSRMSGIDMLFRSFGLAKTVDDAFLIQKFLLSRDVVAALPAEGVDIRAIFTRPEADRLSRHPRIWRTDSNEALYDYFLDHISVHEDSVKGILSLRVVTFRPQDSQLLANTLLRMAEAMVNRMNERAQQDAMGGAQTEVRRAEDAVLAAQAEVTAFRNREVLVDPSKSIVSLIETIGNLNTDLAFASVQLRELQSSSPNNPSIPSLKAKIAALDERVRLERAKMTGGDGSLASKVAIYDQLALRRDIADKSLAAALGALETARQEVRRQHIYIEEVVSANLPDESTEPERLRCLFTVLVLGFSVFAVVWIVTVGAGEHAQ